MGRSPESIKIPHFRRKDTPAVGKRRMKEIQTLLEKDQTLNREAPMRESEDLQQIQQREHRKTNQLDEYFTDRKEMWKKLWSSFQKKPFGSFGCTVEREGATNRYQKLEWPVPNHVLELMQKPYAVWTVQEGEQKVCLKATEPNEWTVDAWGIS